MIGYFTVLDEHTDIRLFLYKAAPIIEPEEINRVFVNLKGLRDQEGFLSTLSRDMTAIYGQVIVTGGENKLVAKAAQALGQWKAEKWHRAWAKSWGMVVPPEDTAKFLAEAPVELLWPLPEYMIKRLKTLGFRRIGQVKNLPLQVLEGQFGQEGRNIYQYSQGQDLRALKRWAPPSYFTAVVKMEYAITDQLPMMLGALAQQLGEQLREYQSSCRQIKVKLTFGERVLASEHKFSKPVYAIEILQESLEKLMLPLWPEKVSVAWGVSKIEASAGELQGLDFHQTELFALPTAIKTPKNLGREKLEKVVVNVQQKYHQSLYWGKELGLSRRDKVLRNWDPLRF